MINQQLRPTVLLLRRLQSKQCEQPSNLVAMSDPPAVQTPGWHRSQGY